MATVAVTELPPALLDLPAIQAAIGAVLGAALACSAPKQQLLAIQAAARGVMQGSAALKNASFRTSLSTEATAEIHARMDCILPVIQERVVAGAEDRRPRLCGSTRATRNVAEHCDFGKGSAAVHGSGKRRQRGGRKRALIKSEVSTEEACVGRYADDDDGLRPASSYQATAPISEREGGDALNEGSACHYKRDANDERRCRPPHWRCHSELMTGVITPHSHDHHCYSDDLDDGSSLSRSANTLAAKPAAVPENAAPQAALHPLGANESHFTAVLRDEDINWLVDQCQNMSSR
jgi:hypothetical protein